MVVRTLRGEGGRYPRELIGVLKKERRCWRNRAAAECDYSLEYSGLPLPETLKPAMAAPTAAREAGGVTLVDVVSGRALDHRNRSEVQRQWMAWRATVRLPSGRRRRLGLYPSREAAVRALDTAVIATYGPTEGVTQAPLRTYAVDPGLRKLPVGELDPLFERLAAEGAARLPRCGKCETCAAKSSARCRNVSKSQRRAVSKQAGRYHETADKRLWRGALSQRSADSGAGRWFHPHECCGPRLFGRREWGGVQPFRLSPTTQGWMLLAECFVGRRLQSSRLTVRGRWAQYKGFVPRGSDGRSRCSVCRMFGHQRRQCAAAEWAQPSSPSTPVITAVAGQGSNRGQPGAEQQAEADGRPSSTRSEEHISAAVEVVTALRAARGCSAESQTAEDCLWSCVLTCAVGTRDVTTRELFTQSLAALQRRLTSGCSVGKLKRKLEAIGDGLEARRVESGTMSEVLAMRRGEWRRDDGRVVAPSKALNDILDAKRRCASSIRHNLGTDDATTTFVGGAFQPWTRRGTRADDAPGSPLPL